MIVFDWYYSPCLSWDPPNVDNLGCVALLGKGAVADPNTTADWSPKSLCKSILNVVMHLRFNMKFLFTFPYTSGKHWGVETIPKGIVAMPFAIAILPQ